MPVPSRDDGPTTAEMFPRLKAPSLETSDRKNVRASQVGARLIVKLPVTAAVPDSVDMLTLRVGSNPKELPLWS